MGADMNQIEEEEVMALPDICCDPAHPILLPSRSQLLVGVVTPRDFHLKGINPPAMMRSPLFSSFAKSSSAAYSVEHSGGVDLPTLFRKAGTEDMKTQVVVRALATKLARSLSMTADDIDASKKLFEYGVDSLVAVELRNWIGKEFAADVPVFDIMGGATITEIGVLITKKSSIVA